MPTQGLVRNFSPVEVFNRANAGVSDAFSIPPQAENMVLVGAGVGGSLTALVVDIEVSHDAGATWQKIQTAINLITAPARVIVTGLAGALVRINGTTVTLNTATAARITATIT